MAKQKATYMGFTAGEEVYFRGLPVKLVRPVAEYEGQTWRVRNNDPEDRDYGYLFNIDPRHRELISRSATKDGVR